ncbi:hypothetical protein QOZ96_003308 [Brevundimonas nasdae]|nr:hypothetical protein [Brevundimonas nasdae]
MTRASEAAEAEGQDGEIERCGPCLQSPDYRAPWALRSASHLVMGAKKGAEAPG